MQDITIHLQYQELGIAITRMVHGQFDPEQISIYKETNAARPCQSLVSFRGLIKHPFPDWLAIFI